MADDHAPGRSDASDTDADEELEAYLLDLARRSPVPERLRYPETPEAYAAAVAEAEADISAGRTLPADEVWAELESRIRARV